MHRFDNDRRAWFSKLADTEPEDHNLYDIVLDVDHSAADRIDFLSEKYTGNRTYPNHNPDSPYLILKIAPDRIDSCVQMRHTGFGLA